MPDKKDKHDGWSLFPGHMEHLQQTLGPDKKDKHDGWSLFSGSLAPVHDEHVEQSKSNAMNRFNEWVDGWSLFPGHEEHLQQTLGPDPSPNLKDLSDNPIRNSLPGAAGPEELSPEEMIPKTHEEKPKSRALDPKKDSDLDKLRAFIKAKQDKSKEDEKKVGELERERAIYESLTDIGEGLGMIGSSGPTTAGGVMFGNKTPPYVSEGTRLGASRADEKISGMKLKEVLGDMGIPIPEGMTEHQIRTAMPAIARSMSLRQQESTEQRMREEAQEAQMLKKIEDTKKERQKAVADERKSFYSDSNVKESRAGLKAARQVKKLISASKNNPREALLALNRAIRASGDNRISNQDRTMILITPGFEGLLEKAVGWITSDVAWSLRDKLEQIANDMVQSNQDSLESSARNRAETFVNAYGEMYPGLSTEDVYSTFLSLPERPHVWVGNHTEGKVHQIPSESVEPYKEDREAQGEQIEIMKPGWKP